MKLLRAFAIMPCLLAVSLFHVVGQADAETRALPEPVTEWIDSRAAERLAEEKSPGISLAIVIDGELVYQKGYGVNTIGDDAPPPEETSYQIASVTKSFVGTLAAKMAADGRVDLDVPITEYVPGVVFHASAQSAPITLRLLLSHQSGLGNISEWDYTVPEGLPDGFDVWVPEPRSTEDLLSGITVTPNVFPVGERYQYSGTGSALAAYVLAEAGGYESFDAALNTELLQPLGMTDTFFRTSDTRDENMATPYAFTNNKYHKMCPLGTEEYYEIPLLTYGSAVGNSGLTSTTGDLARYVSAIMGDGDVLTVEAKDILFEPNTAIVYSNEQIFEIGLMWRMPHFGPYGRVYQHTGYNIGHHAAVLVSDEHDIGVIALTNGSYITNRHLVSDIMLKLMQEKHKSG